MMSLKTHTGKHHPSHTEHRKGWEHIGSLDQNAAGTKEEERVNRHEHAQNLDLAFPKHEREKAIEENVRQEHLVFKYLIDVGAKHCQVKLLLIVVLLVN